MMQRGSSASGHSLFHEPNGQIRIFFLHLSVVSSTVFRVFSSLCSLFLSDSHLSSKSPNQTHNSYFCINIFQAFVGETTDRYMVNTCVLALFVHLQTLVSPHRLCSPHFIISLSIMRLLSSFNISQVEKHTATCHFRETIGSM